MADPVNPVTPYEHQLSCHYAKKYDIANLLISMVYRKSLFGPGIKMFERVTMAQLVVTKRQHKI